MANESGELIAEFVRPVGIIPLHFDVRAHVLPLRTFVNTAERTQDIIESFNRSLFDGRLDYEIYVLPPDDGSFLNKLAIYVFSGASAIFLFAETDQGKALVEGLTNNSPEYYWREAGKYIQKQVLDLTAPRATLQKQSDEAATQDEEKRDGGTALLVETTRCFLQKDGGELRRLGIDESQFRDSLEARNQFYESCAAEKQIRAIGFDERPIFPIRRPDFARLQVAIRPREDAEERGHWIVEIVSLSVTSPNWDRTDRQRNWKGKDANRKERTFSIEDEHFWSLVHGKNINPNIIDTIRVQWAFATDRRRTPRVLKVIEYNGQVLGAPLDDGALQALLGEYIVAGSEQQGLFDR